VEFIEVETLQRLKEGDGHAFTPIVEAYQTPVYNLCYRMLGNAQEAEDAAQETFWRAFQSIHRYDPDRSFITWLLSIAAHYCIDQQRKRRLSMVDIDNLAESGISGNSPDPEGLVHRNEEEEIIQKMLARLNTQDRAVIILKYWYEFSEKEIGKALKLSVSAVKSRLFRARKEIARLWEANQMDTHPEGEKHYVAPAF
jgi:RNA polymerase sigma-70 factor (ECF subfamily)